ncbi:LysM peptidoglycan-binding domain-containing protein [Bacillus sp. HMF5848]|uniref:M14 family metallopeptidase n=1 Tax=Bacillus sp. HMF5848 TaxID=2495421 RepID=UPI000F7A4B93|nr:M14 family metallopeptidase [Bacillus sp. HMF5848]RSK25641.1 LysM peptidoglycan-binding domain-containing protein [Bacillus sp. HMF5848]
MKVFVRQGDSYWYYSQLFNIPLQLIIDSNRTIQPNQLKIGQAINIPGYVAQDYIVQAGDSFWGIAQRRNIPLDALLLVNPSVDPRRLTVGQFIKAPIRITWRLVNGAQEYTYSDMMRDLARLQSVYPFLKQESIGQSVLGKTIPEIVIGSGSKRVHYNGSFHAHEWITTPVIMTFLNDYALALTNQAPIRGLLLNPFYTNVELSIVPMVNPDGVNLVLNGPPDSAPWNQRVIEINNGSSNFSGWKANIRGVDLNNQYPAKWDIEAARKPDKPSPRDYPGEAPLTEPESVAMAELTRRSNFDRALAFHTQGEVIYWGFENLEPPAAQTLVNEFARVSGYIPIKTVDSYAGYKDWFIQDFRKPGFTVELGRGVNPLPISQFGEIYEEALGIFLAGLYM